MAENEKLKELALLACAKQNVELYDLELVGSGRNRVLRVTIDKDGGPTLEDCSQVSNFMSETLDANEEMISGGEYSLEVTSPGVERVLKSNTHFAKVVGQKVRVKLSKKLVELDPNVKKHAQTKAFEAHVSEVVGSNVQFHLEGNELALVPIVEILKSNVVFEMNKGEKKSHK